MRTFPATLRTALLALPAILAAQDAAPVVSLAKQLRSGEAEILKLMDEMDAKGALAKAEAMIPAAKPAFVKTSPKAGLDSSTEYSALMGIYSQSARACLGAGEWEKAKGYLAKAQEIANENSAETTTVVAPLIENWTKAMDASKKALEEGAERRKQLEANDKRTPDEQQELDNFIVHDNNVKRGPGAVASLQGSLDGLKSDASKFDTALNSLSARIKTEQEDMAKFKGDKAAYVKAVLTNKSNLLGLAKASEKAAWLHRLLVLSPGNATALKQLDIVMGKAPAPSAKPAPKAPAKKKA